MLKDKFLADLEGNIYSLHPAFENYKLSDEEIQKICDNPSVEEEENEYTGKELFYDHSSIYLVPVEFIEKFKLSADKIRYS